MTLQFRPAHREEVPAVVALHQRISESLTRLHALTDPDERKDEMRRLADLQTRLAIEQETMGKYG